MERITNLPVLGISRLIVRVSITLHLVSISANAAEADSQSETEKLAKGTQNPVASLISVPFQNNFNFGLGPKQP